MAALIVIAALVSMTPSTTGRTPGGAVLGVAQTPRVAAFGGALRGAAPAPAIGGPSLDPDEQIARVDGAAVDTYRGNESRDSLGPFGPDGSRFELGVPVAPVPDGSDRLRRYKVHSGDSLASIAKHYHLHATTIFWANDLTSTSLKVGQTLAIPPIDGLVVVVKDGDTLAEIAKRTKVSEAEIIDENGLSDVDLTVGQTVIVPGAKGDPMPTPTPVRRTSSGGSATKSTAHYVSGWVFPVVGGGAYISQYFHASHPALDIAADYGTTVRAAHAGKVIFAGWKNNGGGWQVWMSNGNNLYTTYNHMSAVSVSAGQVLGAGARVGRVGQSGWATGPHCHFEVWRGPIWDGGVRVNPLNYV
jgi:murein DD-endopeptidase MepM/ murein hydrolase activator NlpD